MAIFNVGMKKEEELEELIIKQRNAGVYLTCLGIGMGNYKDSKIQTLAQSGNGNFAYIDSYREAEKVLMKEFMQTLYTVADNSFLSVQFNPKYVKEYRLIGFENKTGAIRDSTATIEGGRIGSAYSMIVAFEIVPMPGYLKQLIDPVNFSLRYQNTRNNTACEMNDQPQLFFTPFNQLSPTCKFASAVIMFGSLLRNSKYIKEGTWNDVITIGKACGGHEKLFAKRIFRDGGTGKETVWQEAEESRGVNALLVRTGIMRLFITIRLMN